MSFINIDYKVIKVVIFAHIKLNILNTFKKELLLLLRDPSGLLLLLIMPSLLIVIMTYIQDAPFKDYQEMHFDVLVYNQDKQIVSDKIIASLNASPNFSTINQLDGVEIDSVSFTQAITSGRYAIGIILPKNTSKVMIKATNKIVDDIAQVTGMPSVNASSIEDITPQTIQLVFDPTFKPAMRASLTNALQQYLLQSKFDFLIERLSTIGGGENTKVDISIFDMVSIKEISAKNDTDHARINSVQHNVPAWAIFGMFMIVVPLAGNMLKEKDEGSDMRVRLIPHALRKVMLGKILFYFTLSLIQFTFMLSIGIFVLPLMGLPSLYLGHYPILVIPVVASISCAAVAYGVFIGNIFKTANQAMPFGAISIVILSALGGIWVPVEILPNIIQQMAKVSPLYWSLDGVNAIFLRDGGLSSIIFPCLVLMGISVIMVVIAFWYNQKQQVN
jgi:ABC-2 type transport system permease protein